MLGWKGEKKAMKTVKEVSEITGISIRTLRYYDEIGLLKPTRVSEAGYRLYDGKALEKLWQIVFFRELEVPLSEIKEIMEDAKCDKKETLIMQKALLEQKRNRLNALIELIEDRMKGVNAMNFEMFTDEDVNKIMEHSLEVMEQKDKDIIIDKYGTLEDYKQLMAQGLKDEKQMAQFIKIYGSKDKAIEASLQATGDKEKLKEQQNEIDATYKQFAVAMRNDDTGLAQRMVAKLAEDYKAMFKVDNARYLLLKVAEDYLNHSQLEEATDKQYGEGITKYIGHAIQQYYGV